MPSTIAVRWFRCAGNGALDGFSAFTQGTNQIGGVIDLDALIHYVTEHTPIGVPEGNRIRTL